MNKTALTPPPDTIADLATACRRFVQQALGIELDGSQDTLPILDHYMSIASESSEPILGLVAPAAGAYFGEVVRAHCGGEWENTGEQYETYRIRLEPGPLRFNPIGVAVEVATGEQVAEWGVELDMPERYRRAVEESIDRMGDVREDDYFTFALRFEFLEQAQATLLACKQSEHN